MLPEQIAVLGTILSLLDKLSGWPFGVLVFLIVIGPWLLAVFLATSYRKRHDEVVEMYKSNVRLVEAYADATTGLRQVVTMNTEAMTKLCDQVTNNQYCPMVRIDKKARGPQGN